MAEMRIRIIATFLAVLSLVVLTSQTPTPTEPNFKCSLQELIDQADSIVLGTAQEVASSHNETLRVGGIPAKIVGFLPTEVMKGPHKKNEPFTMKRPSKSNPFPTDAPEDKGVRYL
jgi:hypothetical protein